MTVTLDPTQVDGDGDAAFLLESRHIDDRDGILVVGHHIATRVGDIDLALDNLQLIGLEAHQTSVHDLHSHGVNFGDVAALLVVGVDLNWAGITGHVGIAAIETDEAAVGDIDLVLLAAGVLVEHVHFVGAIDDTIHIATVDADVVAHVAHLLGDCGVGIGKDIADIFTLGIVVVVERGLVPAHVTLTQQVEALDIGKLGLRHLDVLGQEDSHLLTAARQQRQHHQQNKMGQKNRPRVPF